MSARSDNAPLTALLGPTNTGKTHRAVERMLDHPTGMIGLPLRLLAREIYDRMSARVGEHAVALITGEEKRVPLRPRYYVCTVEAMPQDREVDFLAVDEVQLGAHPQRGHVFTDRILHARGRKETWLMGSETVRPLLERLLPSARFQSHPRLSKLRSAGCGTLRALKPRSAVVAFSLPQVYEIAERIRQLRGGAAVVLGALSPRTRNAQVALYQSGEVDYMVATDAIGMGLNMDVEHIAFASTHKFDGRELRPLETAELAQIAGRAGRYLNDGSFGTLAPQPALPEAVAQAIEQHRFTPERSLFWRNSDVDTTSLAALTASLKRRPHVPQLRLSEPAADLAALEHLAANPDVRRHATDPAGVRLLWEVCQIPDFGNFTVRHHAALLGEVFQQLVERGSLDPDWIEQSVSRIDDTRGDIDTLMMRIELVRTWTYISHRPSFVWDARAWQHRTRELEQRLSDALHQRLLERFVEPGRSAVSHARRRPRRPPMQDAGAAEIEADHPFGKLLSMKLKLKESFEPPPADAMAAWAHELVDAPSSAFRLESNGQILAGKRALGRLTRGSDLLHPEVKLTVDASVGAAARMRLQRRLVAWTRDVVSELFAELRGQPAEALSAAGRGLAYQLEHGLGTIPSRHARAQLDALSKHDRAFFTSAGVVFGRRYVFDRRLLEPEAIRQRVALLSAYKQERVAVGWPGDGALSFEVPAGIETAGHLAAGFAVFGRRAIRADALEELEARLQACARNGPFELSPELEPWLGCSRTDCESLLQALGFRREPDGRFSAMRRRSPRRRRARQAEGARASRAAEAGE